MSPVQISNFNFHKREFWQESWVAQIKQVQLHEIGLKGFHAGQNSTSFSILSDAFAPLHCTQGPLVAAAVLLACAALVYRRLSKQVYLLDFACYRPAEDLRVTWKRFMEGSRDCKVSASTKYMSSVHWPMSHSSASALASFVPNILLQHTYTRARKGVFASGPAF